MIIVPADKTAVGKRGTCPLFRKVLIMGIPQKDDKINKNNAIIPKNNRGLVSRNNLMMLRNILIPSLNVDNLLWEFSGRSEYFDSISAKGTPRVKA